MSACLHARTQARKHARTHARLTATAQRQRTCECVIECPVLPAQVRLQPAALHRPTQPPRKRPHTFACTKHKTGELFDSRHARQEQNRAELCHRQPTPAARETDQKHTHHPSSMAKSLELTLSRRVLGEACTLAKQEETKQAKQASKPKQSRALARLRVCVLCWTY